MIARSASSPRRSSALHDETAGATFTGFLEMPVRANIDRSNRIEAFRIDNLALIRPVTKVKPLLTILVQSRNS